MLSTQSLSQKITLHYALAVFILALLSTSVYLAFSYLIAKNQASAAVINISGQQRMLSQRAALFASQLVLAKVPSEQERIRQSLANTIETMALNHQTLTQGNDALNIAAEHSDAIKRLYFGDSYLDARVKKYLNHLQSLLELNRPQLSSRNHHYLYIERQFTPLLIDLDRVVFQYQLEGEANVALIGQAEQALWLITLFILMLEVKFIFRPMKREVQEALIERDAYETRLQEDVEKKTRALKKANQKLNKLSNTDALTGLRNRRSLEHKLKQFYRGYLSHHQSYTLAIIDLDHFKQLNDRYGHKCGDQVLQHISDTFMNGLTSEDIIARYGGEEFVVLMPNCGIHSAQHKIEQLLAQIKQQPLQCEKQSIYISFSAGLAEAKHTRSEDEYDIFKQADQALYRAKKQGREQVKLQEFEALTLNESLQ
ncbi:diguanylate cyclase [Thiomicrorhabdus sediminis]|uniref:diguanylate cyclase n=1 Tax=Thiomicrorhabdus sediminis TaxID=2580412 RepID=A0A4V1HI07_9GAMM|nr:diguanylate cyclase [Thiomicrorhabdus sediminis]QCU90863.1 diguanylate cyclase [Thiomicrorhabdus sediminis]